MIFEADNEKLKGKTIVCTYPIRETDVFRDILSSKGAIVLSLPTIQITPLPFTLKNDVDNYDWIVFTSKNAIPYFFEKIKPTLRNKFAVIGESTAEELEKNGFKPDFIGSGKSGDDFAEEFSSKLQEEQEVLLALGSLAPGTLSAKLSLTHQVDRIDVYKTSKPAIIDNRLLVIIEEGLYDVLIVTSPSAIQNLHSVLDPKAGKLKIISIGKTTSAAIREYGYEPLSEAKESSYEGLAEATIEYLKNK